MWRKKIIKIKIKYSGQHYIIIRLSILAYVFLIIRAISILKIIFINKEKKKEKSEIDENNKNKGLVKENEDEEW